MANSDLFVQIAMTAIIVAIAVILVKLERRAFLAVAKRGWMPPTVLIIAKSFLHWTIIIVAGLLVLEVFGVPARTLWAGLLSVALVIAVAFFASWSLLSNILSSVLLLTFSQARIGDVVELRDTKRDEAGILGRITDINLFFVTIEELTADVNISNTPAVSQIPCHLFFYRVSRCWPGADTRPLIDAFKNGDMPKPEKSQSPS